MSLQRGYAVLTTVPPPRVPGGRICSFLTDTHRIAVSPSRVHTDDRKSEGTVYFRFEHRRFCDVGSPRTPATSAWAAAFLVYCWTVGSVKWVDPLPRASENCNPSYTALDTAAIDTWKSPAGSQSVFTAHLRHPQPLGASHTSPSQHTVSRMPSLLRQPRAGSPASLENRRGPTPERISVAPIAFPRHRH